jgi:hypothetical protein
MGGKQLKGPEFRAPPGSAKLSILNIDFAGEVDYNEKTFKR